MKYYIGIDPSTSSTGYAVVDQSENIIHYGKVEGLADDPHSFSHLYSELSDLLLTYMPSGIACETQYIGPNRETSIKLIRPTGVVLAVSGQYEAPFNFLAPSTWRHMYHGPGQWSKKDSYHFTLKRYPQLEKEFEPFSLLKNGKVSKPRMFNNCNDITDAIGIAIACKRTHEEG